ncbi:hypothetical protein BASA81_013765 [Batrachochytrium salamandrivorans]|nr:hypothetical protein BASA81_013765 [Batrachochytrium salamandrivorans]
MALTAVVGVAVLYAITRPEKAPASPARIPVQYAPAPVVVSTAPPTAEPSTPPPQAVHKESAVITPILAPAPSSALPVPQLETPSWMAKESSVLPTPVDVVEPVTFSIPSTIQEEAPSWISKQPMVQPAHAITPTWMSSREATPALSTPEATELICLNHAVSHTALAESDAVFVYPLASSGYLGFPLAAGQHKSSKVRFVETREGAGEIAQGLAGSGKTVSVLLSSQSVRPMLPSIKRMMHEHIPAAFHISLLQSDEDECAIQTDHSGLKVIRSLPNSVILVSATPSEAQLLAKTAVLLAKKLSRPVFHVLDHVDLNVRVPSTTMGGVPAFPALLDHAFHYSGSSTAKVVLVGMGHAANELESFVSQQPSLGALRVRQLRPWSAADLVKSLPKSVSRVCVLDQTGDALGLFTDVAKSFATSQGQQHVQVSFVKVPASYRGVSPQLVHSACHELGVHVVLSPKTDTDVKNICIFAAAPYKLGKVELIECARVATHADYFADVSLTEVRLSATASSSYSVIDAGQAQVVAVHGDVDAINESGVDVAAPLAWGGTLLLPQGESVPASLLRKIKHKHASVAHYEATSMESPLHAAVELLHRGPSPNGDLNAFHSAAASDVQDSGRKIKGDVFAATSSSYQQQQLDASSDAVSGNGGENGLFGLVPRLPFQPSCVQTETNPQLVATLNTTIRADNKEFEVIARHEIARSLVFKDAFETKAAVVDNHKEETFLVNMVLRKRLTPMSYDRNIFHLEFDIANTGLKYGIGDALGVFAHNDVQEVDDLIAKCGFDGNAFVAFNSGETSEFVSVRNLLIQHLDIFGRPSKKFYVWLSQFATSNYEQLKLSHAGTDDAEAFKLGVAETVTFADLLLGHPSARPGMEELMQVIPRIKARHYSIASSMKFSPRSVSLLIVEVDWQTPKGHKRHGQCTRYLANLPIGSPVKVDVCPSVLRLPPSPEQPIVMAGLGTGMAPFRAFVQERKIQKESGIKVGPIVLYFGARHRSEEWLYGEEWDEYQREGLVTRLGLAFSRDQKEKIYIQHRIQEDAALLHDLFIKQQGYFFLCGPTWPVPDVRDAVAMGLDPVNAKQGNMEIVERLKDEGRYILEVY